MSAVIKLTVPESLANQAERLIEPLGYASRQELILEGLREIVIKKRLELLARGFGAGSEPASLTQEQRRRIIEEYERSGQDLLKELNLE